MNMRSVDATHCLVPDYSRARPRTGRVTVHTARA